ncbi:MAG: HAD family hydrolase [Bdellovibrio sp.]
MGHRIFALDFDGVVCDSAFECLVVSYCVYNKISLEDALKANSAFDLMPSDLYQKAYVRRGFVRPARQFFLLWKWVLEMSEKCFTQEQFESLELDYKDEVASFDENFFSFRNRFRDMNLEKWIGINPLFPNVKEVWNKLSNNKIYIVTTKDSRSVQLIAGFYGLRFDGLYAKGSFVEKDDAIKDILRKENAAPSEVVFVDDNLKNLKVVESLGVPVLGALWGYEADSMKDVPVINAFSDLVEYL